MKYFNSLSNSTSSTFPPNVLALSALVENSHWFITTSDLYLHEVSLLVATLGTIDFSCLDIFPGIISSKNIINLFSCEVYFLFKGLFNLEYVRTGSAIKE